MGHSNLHWLDSYHHFSFSGYYNPENIQFGALRVVNDDLVGPGTGFDSHHHANMEILSYVVEGELTHGDSMGNRQTLTRGQVQYMSAGTGVIHSEHNFGHEVLRFLQIWIFPDKQGYAPQYGDHRFEWEKRIGRWMPVASGDGDKAFPIQIHADVHVFAALIPRGETLTFEVEKGRQAYLVTIEGGVIVNGVNATLLEERDAMELIEESITLEAASTAHLIVLEMAK
jgi:redox-sensitive bicupin YhaK (pirin superfamily)